MYLPDVILLKHLYWNAIITDNRYLELEQNDK